MSGDESDVLADTKCSIVMLLSVRFQICVTQLAPTTQLSRNMPKLLHQEFSRDELHLPSDSDWSRTILDNQQGVFSLQWRYYTTLLGYHMCIV